MQLLHCKNHIFLKQYFPFYGNFFLCLFNEYFVEKFLLQISQQKSILKKK